MSKRIVVQEEEECDDCMEGNPQMTGILDGSVWLNDITESAARDFAASLLKTSSYDPTRPLMVYIDSSGGLIDALASMISVMDSIPNKIITIAMGKAMSAGAILLAHGDYRFVAPYSRVMIHEVSGGAAGNINDVTSEAAEIVRLNSVFLEMFAKDCGIKNGHRGLKKLLSEHRDLYLSADQAVELGVADEVGVPRLNRISQWVLEADRPAPVSKTKEKKK